jgi:hypothetical protein
LPEPYEPVTEGDGLLGAGVTTPLNGAVIFSICCSTAGVAEGSLCGGGVGEADGLAATVPVVVGVLMMGGMGGGIWGMVGVEVNG